MGKSTISMAIFNSYVKLPEGMSCDSYVFSSVFVLLLSITSQWYSVMVSKFWGIHKIDIDY